jgi:hypothetical protein
MVIKILVVWLLMLATVWLHFAAIVLLFLRFKTVLVIVEHSRSLFRIACLLFRVFIVLVVVHVGDAFLWACFYRWKELFPDFQQAFYFSISAYTTLLSGDISLPVAWRLFGRLEAIAGWLMFGLSSSLFFALVNRIYEHRRNLSMTSVSIPLRTERAKIPS